MSLINLIVDVLIFSLIPLGLWVSFRIMRYPDLAIEQVFVLGGVIFGLIVQSGLKMAYIFPTLIVVSFILGFIISFFRHKLELNPIILSLIFSYVFYSLSLCIMDRPNLSLIEYFEHIPKIHLLIITLLILLVLIISFHLFLKSKRGTKVIATGCNSELSKSLGLRSFLHGGIGI